MRYLSGLALLACVVLGACEREEGTVVCFHVDTVTGGQGGENGGAASGGMAGEGGSTDPPLCEAEQPFSVNSVCFNPSAACCDLKGANLAKHCFVATLGAQPVPVACTLVPPLPASAATDDRACSILATTDLGCEWGPSVLLCCEP